MTRRTELAEYLSPKTANCCVFNTISAHLLKKKKSNNTNAPISHTELYAYTENRKFNLIARHAIALPHYIVYRC